MAGAKAQWEVVYYKMQNEWGIAGIKNLQNFFIQNKTKKKMRKHQEVKAGLCMSQELCSAQGK